MFKSRLENRFADAFNSAYEVKEYKNKLSDNKEYWANIRCSVVYSCQKPLKVSEIVKDHRKFN